MVSSAVRAVVGDGGRIGIDDRGLPRGPADRFIVATALALASPLVTKDRTVRDWARSSGRLRVTW